MTTTVNKNTQSNRDWLTPYHKNPLNAEFLNYSEYYETILRDRKKILIIEDDYLSFEVIQTYVKDYDNGLTCFFASNEHDALDIMRRYDCDLVIADYFLDANETGLSVCQKIRDQNQQVAFLIVSSLRSYQYQEIIKYFQIEPDFLEKPVSKKKIIGHLNQIYGGN
jgi:response regulator of citrate/malate metabolism